MSAQEMSAILGIGVTRDEDEIRTTYRNPLVKTDPEDDLEGFKRSRGAYEEAPAYAKTPEQDDAVLEAEWMEEKGPAGEVLRQLADIYVSLPRRLDLEEWKALAEHLVFQSLDESEAVKWEMFFHPADHYRVTCKVWQLLDEVFFIGENEQEFWEHLPDDSIDSILYKVNDKTGNSDFVLELLEGELEADYDELVETYMALMNETDESPEGLVKVKQTLEKLESFDTFHP